MYKGRLHRLVKLEASRAYKQLAVRALAAPSPSMAAAPAFRQTAADGSARTATLTLPSGATIDTPAMLVNTRRGAPMHLTIDMLAALDPPVQGLQLNAMHFMMHPDPPTMRKNGPGQKYLGLEGFPMLCGVRDPTLPEYGAKASSEKAAYITIHSGGFFATPADLADAIDALQPETYVALAHEIAVSSRRKLVRNSVNRTALWLEQALEEHASKGLHALLLAPVVGGGLPEERQRSAEKAVEHDAHLAGYSLSGLGTGELRAQRKQLLDAALSRLPAGKIRHIPGLASFRDIVQAMDTGFDLFDSSLLLPHIVGGRALVFAMPDAPAGAAAEAAHGSTVVAVPADAEGADGIMDLWDTKYRLDQRPLLVGCKCHTCQHHTRAYIHHLLQCHEMLSSVLLEAHNTHHALRFFQAARAAIAGGRWAQFRAAVEAGPYGEGVADGAVVADLVAEATASHVKPSLKQEPNDRQ